MKKDGNFGLSTYDALGILHDDIDNLLKDKISSPRSKWTDLKNLFCHGNEHSTISWLSASVLVAVGLILIISSFLTESSIDWYLFSQGVLIILICISNIILVLWDDHLRLTEIPSKVIDLLSFLKECQEKVAWEGENYPHLCSPYSPCITLQWTYRDQRLVNLPWSLLVRGDTVLLRPGQPAPAYSISPETGCRLACGEVYSPPQKHENISLPTARTPLPNKRFVLQETPLLRNIREVLEQSDRCPITCYDKERYLITVTVSLHIILPILLSCNILINIIWYLYAGEWNLSGHWLSVFILQPIAVILPLLPLVLPIGWIFLNTLGYAKTSAFLQSSFLSKCNDVKSGDPFEEISIQEEGVEEVAVGLQWCQHLLHTLQGRQHFLTLTRTINPLHVFGSVTALCCVDKKGILSWPNPTAEKVFFLRSAPIKPSVPSELSRNPCDEDLVDEDTFEALANDDKDEGEDSEKTCEMGTVSEVLDLTHDSLSPFKLYFDDTRWQEHLGSLKPLGLAILLNTCNPHTHDHYLQFCSHVTCEALYNEDLVPVTNRRCLCELSKQIGFTDDVIKNFKLLEQLSTFRHVQPETVRRDIKFARSLALATKLKLPFPHMVSVITSEVAVPNSIQLFSQATGDIALDSCIDFWDGSTLKILTSSDRKKVLDFYQRTSLTAYCTAFGYRPLSRSVDHCLSSVYMELPADSQPLYIRNRSPTPIYPQHLTLSQSIDSLFGGGDVSDDVANDIEGCFEVQCNQIFLGMVTMQYQAQAEMVTLIEQLERACIRFVHFSKENELRSRVFSEKMGLESGWNCHISLLSSEPIVEQTFINEEGDKEDEKNSLEAPLLGQVKRGSLEGSKTISASAPCDLGVDQKNALNQRRSLEEDMESHGSIHDGWQSLSCLTDSTESAPINLIDLKNRAKLPRGIDHVRPHLEQVDNVPLLVSLFTDCTPATTRQMIGIMQDYGRVVTVIGSSANADNCGVFLKANASVSMEPMYPQVCQKVSVYRCSEECISPCHLGQRLNSLPCCVSISRQRPTSLFHLIMQCRHYMMCLWNALQFWVCSCVAISILQLLCTLLILPPLFSFGQVLWLCCVAIPLLSASLVFTPTSPKVMQRPGAKTHPQFHYQVGVFVIWCYGGKILVSLLLVPLLYTLTLTANCPRLDSVLNITCHPFLPLSFHTSLPPQVFAVPLYSSQTLAFTLTLLHLVTISISFVYRDKLSWHKSPLHNKVWLFFAIIVVSVHLIYLLVYLFSYPIVVPWYCILVSVLSPIPLFALNELIKWSEIKVNVRYERRARLDFGTKLGMNSPF